ncbi:MAG: hypothetical protein WCR42_01155 [bacterium]
MKNTIILSLLISLVLISCESTIEPTPENQNITILKKAQASADSAVASIFSEAAAAGIIMKNNNFEEGTVRAELQLFLTKHPNVEEAIYVEGSGVLTFIEPRLYSNSEGVDISQQEHTLQMKSTKSYAMSGLFKVVEGFYAVVVAAPILENGIVIGSVNIVIKPHKFLKDYTDLHVLNKVDDFFVMETNGNMIYDIDSTQVGRNVFTDSLYKAFPTLIAAAHNVVESDNGLTYYSFLDKTKQTTVYKNVWWRTSSYYGRVWKYCVVKERV